MIYKRRKNRFILALFSIVFLTLFSVPVFLLIQNSSSVFAQGVPVPEITEPPSMFSSQSNQLIIRGYKLTTQDQVILCHNSPACTADTGSVVAGNLQRSWYKLVPLSDGKNIISVVARKGNTYSDISNYYIYWTKNDPNKSQVVPSDLQSCLGESNPSEETQQLYNTQANNIYNSQPGNLNNYSSLSTYSGQDRTSYGYTMTYDDTTFSNFDARDVVAPSTDQARQTTSTEAVNSQGALNPGAAANYNRGNYGANNFAQSQAQTSSLLAGNKGIYCMNTFTTKVANENYIDEDIHESDDPYGGYDDNGDYVLGNGVDLDDDGTPDEPFEDVGQEYVGEECEDGSIGNCPCGGDNDCDGDQICDIGACIDPECTDPKQCTSGVCENGRCIDCRTDDDCRGALVCGDYGECVECTKESDCEADEICDDEECEKVECKSAGDCSGAAGYTGICSSYTCNFFPPEPDSPDPPIINSDGCPSFFVQMNNEFAFVATGLHANTTKNSEDEDIIRIPYDADELRFASVDYNIQIKVVDEIKELFFLNNLGMKAVIHPADQKVYTDSFGKYKFIRDEMPLKEDKQYQFTYPWRLPYYYALSLGFQNDAMRFRSEYEHMFDIFITAGNYLVTTITQKEGREYVLPEHDSYIYDDSLHFLVSGKMNEDLRETKFVMGKDIDKREVDLYYSIINGNEFAGRLMYEMTKDYMSITPEFWDDDTQKWSTKLSQRVVPEGNKKFITLPDTSKVRLINLEDGYEVYGLSLVHIETQPDYIEMDLPMKKTFTDAAFVDQDTVQDDISEFDEQRVILDQFEPLFADFDSETAFYELKNVEAVTGEDYTITFFITTGGYYEVFREK